MTSQTTSWDATNTVRTEVIVERTPAGVVASRKAKTFQEYPFGERLRTSTDDPGGANLVTTWEYHAGVDAYGEIGRLHRVSYPDGNWTTYRYDRQGRIISTVTPWKNTSFDTHASRTRAKLHSYVPHDPRDTVTELDARPRTVEVKILNITVSKTLSAYYTDNGCQVVVVERCQRPEAVYGDADNLRTEWRYYPQGSAANSASAGRLHTVTYPHGVRDTFAYEYGTWQANADPAIPGVFTAGTGYDLRATATRGTTASPAGIANRTLRKVTIFDAAGDKVFAARQVYTGTDYALLDWQLMTYDGLHRQIALLQSNGELTETTWNCCAKASETLPDGTQYTYAYDALRRLSVKTLVGVDDQPDLVTTYTYDAVGNNITETVSGGNLSTTATRTYDLAGRLTASVNMQGLTTAYTHLPGVNTGSQRRGAATTIIHPGGFTTTRETFCDGRPVSETGDAQVSRYYDYDINVDGTQWALTRTGGGDSPRWEKVTTDCLGRVRQVEKSGFNGTVTTGYHYNAVGQLVRMEQTGMADTLYEYDALGTRFRSGLDVDDDGTLTLVSNDRIAETSEEYRQDVHDDWWLAQTQKIYATANDATVTTISIKRHRLSGFATHIVSENENIDIHGNVTKQTRVLDRAAKTVVDSALYPDSIVAEQWFSVNGLPISQRSRSNLTTILGYDGLRRPVSVTESRIGTTSIAYHTVPGKIGLMATETDAAGNSTSYDYDAITGRLLWKKNALDKYTRYAYNARGQQTRVWGDTEYPVEYGYDQYGQKISMTTFRAGNAWNGATWPDPAPSGDATTWTYDAASGLVTAKTYADGNGPTYTYMVDGKLATRTWARTDANDNPLVTTYSYDSATGELFDIDYSDATPDIAYTYTRTGQPLTVTDVVGTRTFAYNAQLQEISETITGGLYSKVLTRTYTANGMKGRRLGLAVDNVQNYTYRYDAYGRMDQITTSAGTFDYTRLPDSDLVSQMTRPNGIITTWSYETNRDLVTQVQNGTISTYGYVNDAIGRRTSMSRSGTAYPTSDAITYTYNNRDELIGAVSDNVSSYTYAYAYDSIGNRISANEAGVSWTYVANNLNQYTTTTEDQVSMFPTYDLDGNMTYRSAGATTGWTQVWNGENCMVESCLGNERLEFTYDYMGRRVGKKIYDDQEMTSYLEFIYDGFKLIEEFDSLNADLSLHRCYVWQPDEVGSNVVLQMMDISDNKHYLFLHDANKNIMQILNEISTIIVEYNYSPFGNSIKNILNKPRLNSGYPELSLGLLYYNYYQYVPQIGRFFSRAKIDFNDKNHNVYSSSRNNLISKLSIKQLKKWFDWWLREGVDILEGVSDPINPHCLGNEGWFRHCRSTCIVSRRLGPFWANAIAMIGLNDYPWSRDADSRGDAYADLYGSIIPIIRNPFSSCHDKCLERFLNLVIKKCCPGKYKLLKGDPNCCRNLKTDDGFGENDNNSNKRHLIIPE